MFYYFLTGKENTGLLVIVNHQLNGFAGFSKFREFDETYIISDGIVELHFYGVTFSR